MKEIEFYNGEKLLNKKDINNEKPRFFMSVGGRSTGKTTFWNGFLLNEFLEKGNQFVLLYRYKYEIDNIAKRFFDSISFKFPNLEMKDRNTENLGFTYLYIDEKECGYAIAINSADNIKKYSSIFSKVKYILFDEFIPETTPYCQKELQKFLSLYISIARGNGQAIRSDVTFIMLANISTNDNLYFRKFKIKRTNNQTRFQRGNGVVVEFVENKDIKEIQEKDKVIELLDNGYITGDKTLDNYNNVEKQKIGQPLFNFVIENEKFGIYKNGANLYVSEKCSTKNDYKFYKNEDCDCPYSSLIKMSFNDMVDKNHVTFETIHAKRAMLN